MDVDFGTLSVWPSHVWLPKIVASHPSPQGWEVHLATKSMFKCSQLHNLAVTQIWLKSVLSKYSVLWRVCAFCHVRMCSYSSCAVALRLWIPNRCFKIMASPAPGVQPAPKSGCSRARMCSTGLMILLHVCWRCSTSAIPGSDRQTERQSGFQHWRSLVVCEVCHSSKSMHDLDLQSWL